MAINKQFTSNMGGKHVASLTLNTDQGPKIYTPFGADTVVDISSATVFEYGDVTYAQVSEAVSAHRPIWLHISGQNVNYMVPYVGGANDTGFRFAIANTQNNSLQYWLLKSDDTWDTGSYVPEATIEYWRGFSGSAVPVVDVGTDPTGVDIPMAKTGVIKNGSSIGISSIDNEWWRINTGIYLYTASFDIEVTSASNVVARISFSDLHDKMHVIPVDCSATGKQSVTLTGLLEASFNLQRIRFSCVSDVACSATVTEIQAAFTKIA